MPDQDPLLEDLDAAVAAIRQRHADALVQQRDALLRVCATGEAVYAALRRRQAVRVAAQVDAPVPCRDCFAEVPIVDGAGTYTRGALVHEIVYESDDLPFATCGLQP